MLHGFRERACFLLVIAALLTPPARSAPPPTDEMALRASLQMLHLEMKHQVLQTYYQKADFYIPPAWPKRIQDEYQKVAEDAGASAKARMKEMDDWLAASTKARENEVLEAYKIAEEWIGKLRKHDEESLKEQQEDLAVREFFQKPKKSVLEVARFMEDIARKRRLANKGGDPKEDAWTMAMSARWELQAKEIYRGAIKDTDNLLLGIARFDQERREIEERLVFLKNVETGFEAMGIVREPGDKLLEKAEEYARDKTVEWLKSRYTDIDDKAVEGVWKTSKKILTDSWELRGKLKELDDDAELKDNPVALGAAKRFAVLGSLYKQTLGLVKKIPGADAFGPILDFLDFYGEALGMMPELTKKTQAMVRKIDQNHHGIRANDAFNVTGKGPAKLIQVDTLREKFGVVIAYDSDIDPEGDTARYYLLVPKEVMPRQFATLDRASYQRLCEALAYERFLNAPKEAWRGPQSWVLENMFEWRNTAILSQKVSDAYLADLKEKAKKTPFKEKDWIDLAQGRSVNAGSVTWSHQRLETLADAELDARANELLLRTAAAKYDPTVKQQWKQFEALLLQHKVALAPKQIQNLFSYYAGSGGNAEHLGKYLQALGDERSARARGKVAAGIPLLTTAVKLQPVTPGKPLDVVADVLVSDLAPGRVVDAEVRWELPSWAPAPPVQAVKIGNGITAVKCRIDVPAKVELKPFEAKVIVKVPGEDGLGAVLEATTAMLAATSRPAVLGASVPPAVATVTPKPPEPRQFDGEGTFDVETSASGVQIALRRVGSGNYRNGIAVTSATLGQIKPGDRNGVEFVLYRAESAAGPFEVRPSRDHWVYGRGETVKPEQGKMGFIADDTYLLLDDPEAGGDEKSTRQRGPFHYRVGQFAVNADGERVGKEAKSNVAGPQGAIIRIIDAQLNEQGVITTSSGMDQWCRFQVALAVENQCYDVWDAHVTVSNGKWAGHFWTARQEGDIPYGTTTRIGVTGSSAWVRVPYFPAGGSVTIQASGGGLNATKQVKLPADEKSAAFQRDSSARILAQGEKYLQDKAAVVPNLEKAAEEAAKRFAEATPPKTFSDAHSDRGLKESVAKSKVSLRWTREYELVGLPQWNARAAAEARWDWAGALDAMGKDEALSKLANDLSRETLKAEMDSRDWVLSFPGDFSNLRASYEADKRRHAERMESLARKELDDLWRIHDKRAVFALLAGDAGSYRQARTAQLQTQEALKWGPSTMSGLYLQAAEELAIVSGDRAAAAAWWNTSVERTLAALQPDQREAYKTNYKARPAYYPSAGSGP